MFSILKSRSRISSKSCRQANRRRTLRFESLDRRVMLSAAPALGVIPPIPGQVAFSANPLVAGPTNTVTFTTINPIATINTPFNQTPGEYDTASDPAWISPQYGLLLGVLTDTCTTDDWALSSTGSANNLGPATYEIFPVEGTPGSWQLWVNAAEGVPSSNIYCAQLQINVINPNYQNWDATFTVTPNVFVAGSNNLISDTNSCTFLGQVSLPYIAPPAQLGVNIASGARITVYSNTVQTVGTTTFNTEGSCLYSESGFA